MTATRYEIPVKDPERILRERDLGHRLVMSLLPNNLDHEHPRACGNTLWTLTQDTLIIQTSSELDKAGCPVQNLAVGETVLLSGTFVFSRSHTAHIPQELRDTGFRSTTRGRKTFVDPGEHQEYLTRRLEDNGFQVNRLISLVPDMAQVSKKKGKAPCSHQVLEVTVTDADAANDLITTGIGKYKSYGCGLITIH